MISWLMCKFSSCPQTRSLSSPILLVLLARIDSNSISRRWALVLLKSLHLPHSLAHQTVRRECKLERARLDISNAFFQVTSSIVVIFRSMEIFNVPLSIAINRICRVMGAECITLLRVISFKIDLKLGTVYEIPSKMKGSSFSWTSLLDYSDQGRNFFITITGSG